MGQGQFPILELGGLVSSIQLGEQGFSQTLWHTSWGHADVLVACLKWHYVSVFRQLDHVSFKFKKLNFLSTSINYLGI